MNEIHPTSTGNTVTYEQREELAELLKERIYASLALLAVLVGLNPSHHTPIQALAAICGTALSLWAASVVAQFMASNALLGKEGLHMDELAKQFRIHAPLLGAAIPAVVCVGLAYMGIISLGAALFLSSGALILSLIGWSVFAAKGLHTDRTAVVVTSALYVFIGAAVVSLKVLIEH